MVLGDAVSMLEMFVWILNHLVSVQLKSTKLCQMTNLNLIFHEVV